MSKITNVLISFEGPEGGGKSTQSKQLAEWLEASGQTVRRTREPGGTPLGDKVRELLLDPKMEINALAEFLLFTSSRAQHVSDTILPAMKEGMVITDRYYDSSLAYQGYGRGLDLAVLKIITNQTIGSAVPNLTILLDLDPKLGLERAAVTGNPDRLERADLSFHQKVREGFLELASEDADRFVVLDATMPRLEIHEHIVREVISRFID